MKQPWLMTNNDVNDLLLASDSGSLILDLRSAINTAEYAFT